MCEIFWGFFLFKAQVSLGLSSTANSCDFFCFTFGFALIRAGFFIHFMLPHARGDYFVFGAGGNRR